MYFDNVIIGAQSEKELDKHASTFLSSMNNRYMSLNKQKTVYGVTELPILWYCVGKGKIKPDPDRLKALYQLPPRTIPKSLKRALKLIAYYAKRVLSFSDKISRLKKVRNFPMTEVVIDDFENLKEAIATATLQAIDEKLPFTVECDASDIAVSATLNQNRRPVAFMSRSLQGSDSVY